MEHHFNVELATRFGVEKAVIIHNLYFWINHNAKNKKHIYDESVWTFNSSTALAKLFPYIKERTISRYMLELENDGIIKTGNYNNNTFDKTKWYSFTPAFLKDLCNLGYDVDNIQITQNRRFDTQKMANRLTENGEPIPYNKLTDKKQKEEREESLSKKDELFEECWKAYRRKGSKSKSKSYWNKLKDDEKNRVLDHIKAYVSARDINYQQDFERYLRDKTFDSLVIKGNDILFDPTCATDTAYHPFGNYSILYDDISKQYIYIGYYDGRMSDGYTDDNRPDGATIILNSGRGTIVWSKAEQKWIHKKI